MTLDNVTDNLRNGYKQLAPGSMRHGYELMNERRTCTDKKLRNELRNNPFYTADGLLYTVQNEKVLLGITRLPQNLVLRHIDDVFTQLIQTDVYFPPADEARASFEHDDTVVVDLKGLNLMEGGYKFGYNFGYDHFSDKYGHFVVDPRTYEYLNSQQKRVAQRLFGPDEENFGQNIEMLVKAGISPHILVLLPKYAYRRLKEVRDKEYFGLPSLLGSFHDNSDFYVHTSDVTSGHSLRGICLREARSIP
jgi:hypothetical protein